jgi:hypothetical protein
MPVDAELAADLLLAGVPVPRLDELHDCDVPAPPDRSDHHPERRRRLTLAVSGVDDHQRVGPA